MEAIAEAVNLIADERDAMPRDATRTYVPALRATVVVREKTTPGPVIVTEVPNFTTLVVDKVEVPGEPIVTEIVDLHVGGKNVSWDVELKDEYTNSGRRWSGHRTGRQVLIVGQIGDKKSLPQKSDGTFSWDKAANHLLNRVRHDMRQEQLRHAKISNHAIRDDTKAKLVALGWREYGAFSVSETELPDRPISVKVSFNLGATTPERALEVYAGLKALGLYV